MKEPVPATPSVPVLRLEPTRGWVDLRLSELWSYRELVYFLTWRDIKVRYKQTLLGASWAILQPLMTMVVFSVFFGRLARMPSDGIPYPIFSFAGLVPWTFFAGALVQASNSLVGSSHLVKKIYFPRLAIPIAGVVAGLVDLAIAFGVLLILMIYYGVAPSVQMLWLPLFIAMALATALGVGLWLAALNVQFRDVRYVVPFITQFWMFATPVAYPSSMLDEPWRTLYGLNPMVGVVEGVRWSMLGAATSPGPQLAVSAGASLLLLVSGAFYFRRMETTFADVI